MALLVYTVLFGLNISRRDPAIIVSLSKGLAKVQQLWPKSMKFPASIVIISSLTQ